MKNKLLQKIILSYQKKFELKHKVNLQIVKQVSQLDIFYLPSFISSGRVLCITTEELIYYMDNDFTYDEIVKDHLTRFENRIKIYNQ